MRRPSSRSVSRPSPLTALLVALPAALLAACGTPDDPIAPGADVPPDGNVLASRAQTLQDNPRLEAAARQTAADGDASGAAALERLAGVPTGIWLTPERFDATRVGAYVSDIVTSTRGRSVPVFVVYGIPDRDCTGGFSAGGLTTETYLPWVQAIADAATLDGAVSVAVVEPDALAGSVSCGTDDRLDLITGAVEVLTAAGVTTYVDAGHSDWVPAETMAPLLRQVGVGAARGFATNVSNYQPEARERAFAAELSGLLDGAHFVIDVGRSGDPSGTGRPVQDWCNPRGRALGDEPGYVDDGTPLDALLWIKPPAESDGECHGGPPAGQTWIPRALQLASAAGW